MEPCCYGVRVIGALWQTLRLPRPKRTVGVLLLTSRKPIPMYATERNATEGRRRAIRETGGTSTGEDRHSASVATDCHRRHSLADARGRARPRKHSLYGAMARVRAGGTGGAGARWRPSRSAIGRRPSWSECPVMRSQPSTSGRQRPASRSGRQPQRVLRRSVASDDCGGKEGEEPGDGSRNRQDVGPQQSHRNGIDAEDDAHPHPEIRLEEPAHWASVGVCTVTMRAPCTGTRGRTLPPAMMHPEPSRCRAAATPVSVRRGGRWGAAR